MWVDMDRRGAVPGPEQAPLEMEMAVDEPGEDNSGMVEEKRREKGERGGERVKADGKRKDCFAFSSSNSGGGGGVNSSSSSSSSSHTGSSSSESEVEQQDRQRQMNQWDLKRPGIMEPNADAGKRQRNT